MEPSSTTKPTHPTTYDPPITRPPFIGPEQYADAMMRASGTKIPFLYQLQHWMWKRDWYKGGLIESWFEPNKPDASGHVAPAVGGEMATFCTALVRSDGFIFRDGLRCKRERRYTKHTALGSGKILQGVTVDGYLYD